MQLKSLKIFCDVVGRRSFSRAAEENGISQSGASQVILQMEERLGVKLLDRSKRPFILTPEGRAYYEGCRRVVKRYYALEEEIRTLHQDVAGRVDVAAIYSVGLSHIHRLLQEFLAAWPKTNVRLEYQHPDRVYTLVENDQVDIGLISFAKSTRTIKAIPWRDETMALVCSPEHRLAVRKNISLKELHRVDLIGFDRHLKIRREIDRALAAQGAEVNVVMEFDNIEIIKRAVEINAGVALLPEPTVQRELQAGTLVTVPLHGPTLVRPLAIIYRRGREMGKTARQFMRLLLDDAERNGNGSRDGAAALAAVVAGEAPGNSKPKSKP